MTFKFRNLISGKQKGQLLRLTYHVDMGFDLESMQVDWGTDRESVRKLLGAQPEVADHTVDLAKYFDGDTSHNIKVLRDIYSDYADRPNSFFLNYNTDNAVCELEIHSGVRIEINDITFALGDDIQEVMQMFLDAGNEILSVNDGEYTIPALKLTLLDAEACGGDGHAVSYFYCARDISHVLDEMKEIEKANAAHNKPKDH